jgi:hypothetical protein
MIEDATLCRAWAAVGMDVVSGTDQTGERYWQHIEDSFINSCLKFAIQSIAPTAPYKVGGTRLNRHVVVGQRPWIKWWRILLVAQLLINMWVHCLINYSLFTITSLHSSLFRKCRTALRSCSNFFAVNYAWFDVKLWIMHWLFALAILLYVDFVIKCCYTGSDATVVEQSLQTEHVSVYGLCSAPALFRIVNPFSGD